MTDMRAQKIDELTENAQKMMGNMAVYALVVISLINVPAMFVAHHYPSIIYISSMLTDMATLTYGLYVLWTLKTYADQMKLVYKEFSKTQKEE